MRSSSPRESSENSGTRASSSIDSPGLIAPPSRGDYPAGRVRPLTRRAPVRRSVGIALAAGGDSIPASGARLPGAAIDGPRRAAGLDSVAHERGGLDDD